jgi:hypothetical protein
MPKTMRVFTENLKAECPFSKDDEQVGKLLCSICNSQFSLEHGGRSDMLQHIKERKDAIAVETWTGDQPIARPLPAHRIA